MTTPKRKPQKSSHGRTTKAARPARKVAPATPRYSEQYERALKEYEQGSLLFLKKNFEDAGHIFESILKNFSEASEICDRARQYLSICRERLNPKTPRPNSASDHFHLGVYHLNRADSENALKEFGKAAQKDPKSDMVHYGAASAHALAGDKPRAVASLKEAIRLNEKNRIYAQNDPDFDRIRDEHEFIQLVEPEEASAS